MPTKVEFTNQLSGRNRYEDLDHIVERFEWKIKKAHIVTAYWDYASLNSLISYIKTHRLQGVPTNVEVYLNKVQLDSRKDQLKKLNRKILRFCEDSDSGIYVLNTGFMHVKAFQFEGRSRGVLILGSANLTKPGLTSNEEAIIEIPYSTARKKPEPVQNFEDFVNDHFDSDENEDSGDLMTYIGLFDPGKQSSKTLNLRDLFERGKLWYDANAVDPFRFPLNLPKEIRQNDNLPERMANILDTEISDSLNLKRLIQEADIERIQGIQWDGETQQKVLWKQWTIETTLGRWSPQEFEDQISQEIAKYQSKEEEIRAYADCLEYNQQDVLVVFLVFIEDMARFIIEQGIRIREGTWAMGGRSSFNHTDGTFEEAYVKQMTNIYQVIWANKIGRILGKLQNEQFIHRLATSVYDGPMPDIWEQEDIVEPFFSSFIESLNYYIEVGSHNKVAAAAKQRLKQGTFFDDIGEFESLCLASDSSFLRLLQRAGR